MHEIMQILISHKVTTSQQFDDASKKANALLWNNYFQYGLYEDKHLMQLTNNSCDRAPPQYA